MTREQAAKKLKALKALAERVAVMLHLADMMATHFDEREEADR